MWPEDIERLRRLGAALSVAAAHDDVEFIEGDLVERLEPVVHGVEPSMLVCVMHSATFAYLDEATFHRVEETLDQLGNQRDMVRLAFEGPFVEPFVSQARLNSGRDLDRDTLPSRPDHLAPWKKNRRTPGSSRAAWGMARLAGARCMSAPVRGSAPLLLLERNPRRPDVCRLPQRRTP